MIDSEPFKKDLTRVSSTVLLFNNMENQQQGNKFEETLFFTRDYCQ